MSEENPAQGIGDPEKPTEPNSDSEDSIYISVDARNVCYNGGIVPLLSILRQLNRLSEISEIPFQIDIIAPGWLEDLRQHTDEISETCRLIPIMTWKHLNDKEVDDYLTVALAKANNGYYISNDNKMHQQIGEDDCWRNNNQITFDNKNYNSQIQPWKLKIPESEFSELYNQHFENEDLLVELNEDELQLLSKSKEKRKWQNSGWICPSCGSRFTSLRGLINHTEEEGHSEDFYLEDASMVMRLRSKKPVRTETIVRLEEIMDKYRSIPFEELNAIVTGIFEGVLGCSVRESLIVELRNQVGLFVICKQSILEGAPPNMYLEVRERLVESLDFEGDKIFLYIFTEKELDPLDPYMLKNTDSEEFELLKERIETATMDFAACAIFPRESDEGSRESFGRSTVCKVVDYPKRRKKGRLVVHLEVSDFPLGKVIGWRGKKIRLIEKTVQRIFGNEVQRILGNDNLNLYLEATEGN